MPSNCVHFAMFVPSVSLTHNVFIDKWWWTTIDKINKSFFRNRRAEDSKRKVIDLTYFMPFISSYLCWYHSNPYQRSAETIKETDAFICDSNRYSTWWEHLRYRSQNEVPHFRCDICIHWDWCCQCRYRGFSDRQSNSREDSRKSSRWSCSCGGDCGRYCRGGLSICPHQQLK